MTTPPIPLWIEKIPKVELHVHLEGSVRPETLLKLAARHQVPLPAADVAGLRNWYTFSDFNHFIQIYRTISTCLKTAEDIELITREFLVGQAEQNIFYSEVTFTPFSQFVNNQLGFHEQMDAVVRARSWAEKELGVTMNLIIDIPRIISPEDGLTVVEWIVERKQDGIVALGLGGPEVGHPPEKYIKAYNRVHQTGLPCILHAGETVGPESIWSAIRVADSVRIGHGVRAIEDPDLVVYLKEKQVPLEVCPTSNLCLKVYPSLAEHSLPHLVEAGLYVTINSDDPPMFNTTLTREYQIISEAFGYDREMIQKFVLNAVEASRLDDARKKDLRTKVQSGFQVLE
jgi:adenosine deaminase